MFNASVIVAVTLLATMAADAAPVIFWASDGVGPRDTVLVYGGPFEKATRVMIGTLTEGKAGTPDETRTGSFPMIGTEVFQPKLESVKFRVPTGLRRGVYQFHVETPEGRSNAFYLNRPQIRFVQPTTLLPGLGRNQAAPGSTLQMIGHNLMAPGGKEKPLAALRKGNSKWTLPRTLEAEKYSVIINLPRSLPSGEYELCVHNGSGGPLAWSAPFRFTVKQPEQWSQDVFNVRDFGAKGNDVDDDTTAVRAALQAAEDNGGGVAYFPWGIYRISDWIFVPARTTLRGEDRETTWLKWPESNPSSPDELANGAIYTASQCALENLSIVVRNAQVCVRDLSWGGSAKKELADRIRPSGESRDLFLRHVRIQHLYLSGRPKGPFFDRYEKQDMLTLGMNGIRNVEISDCEFFGTQRFLNLENARFDGNSFSNQHFLSWTDLGGSHFVFQGNTIRGASSWRGLPLEYIYSAHNTSFNLERGEREAMTFDINRFTAHKGGAWFGKVAVAEGLTLRGQDAKWLPDDLVGLQALIIAGRGAGQYREITENTADTARVNSPWDVAPDGESQVAIYGLRRHAIIYDCDGSDTSAMAQLWGTYYDMIIDGCHARRDQGIWGLGGWFVQMRDNQLTSGLSFHPGIGPSGINPESNTPYAYVGFVGPGLLNGTAPSLRGAILRNNKLSYNHRLALHAGYGTRSEQTLRAPSMVDVVIDGNSIDHSAVGIQIDRNASGVFVSKNKMDEVAVPLQCSSGDVWLHPGERLSYQLDAARQLLGDKADVTSLGKAAEALRQQPAKAAEAGYTKLLSQLWAAVASCCGESVTPELLSLLVGLHSEFDPASPVVKDLAVGKSGPSEVRLRVQTDPWAPSVQVSPTIVVPEGWQAAAPIAPITLKPGEPQTVVLPLQTPVTSDLRLLGVKLNIDLDGRSLPFVDHLNVGNREVRNWMSIGPFANSSGKLPDTDIHPAEVRMNLNGTYDGLNGKVSWQSQSLPNKYLHFDKFHQPQTAATAYAIAVVRAEEDTGAALNLWCRGGMEAWLNDEKIVSLDKDSGKTVRVSLVHGDNVLLCKSSVLKGSWEIAAEVNEIGESDRISLVQVPAAEMKNLPALTPPPLKQVAQGSLLHDGGIAWRQIFADEFERRPLGDRWRVASGDWQIKDGVLQGGQRSFISYAEKVAAPVRIEYDARSASPHDLSCSWFREPGDQSTGYLIAFAAGDSGSRVEVFGANVGASDAPEARALPNRWYHVIARILSNGTVQLFANDKEVLNLPGNSRPSDKAYPGLWTWGGGEFDKVRFFAGG